VWSDQQIKSLQAAENADRILVSVLFTTSLIRQAAQPLWEIAAGVNCSIATIASRTRWSTASAGG
jgi:hypothetical protein